MRHLAALLWLLLVFPVQAAEPPVEVSFLSGDGRTVLRAFAFVPQPPPPWPAVVMLHGRSGAYSSAAGGVFDGSTLSQRHLQWGRFFAERGYLGLHVDSFGPRGYAQGFAAGTYASRPPEINEQRVRPLDAYGAAHYLRGRGDVSADRIGFLGWSNGAMAGLATMSASAPGLAGPSPANGFRAAVLFYPGCRMQARSEYRPYAPILLFIGSEDEEVSPLPCRQLAEQLSARAVSDFELVWYPGATHAFDDPGRRRQRLEANRIARTDAMERAERFFAQHLRER